ALAAGLATFFLARRIEPPLKALEFADAFGLALFTMLGAAKSLDFKAAPVIAVTLGTMTGVAGGMLRDVLLNELPLVFRREIRLYATAAIAGATVFVLAQRFAPDASWPLLLGVGTTLALRLAAIRWDLSLPLFETRNDTR
ncbi:MAG: TRIC cation channel family protein, partial [Verrucomicrobia bacterium]|nr:TRIC cation channel family protein [Verrucomicrobiota bacterium]